VQEAPGFGRKDRDPEWLPAAKEQRLHLPAPSPPRDGIHSGRQPFHSGAPDHAQCRREPGLHR